ncbi:MAG: RimK family alpha-L-glutamate ligase [Chloroflexi bacterium]|nr:MAG: RimK family alpha-L-glutamate ligase [Chloroflexota bacterium]HEY67676.1 RimK family alpha-L-glutamate ligase [Thermoflexia bacterium]
MKIGILGQRGGWHVTALQEALARRGITAPCFPITRLMARLSARPWLAATGEPLETYDVLFVRTIPGGSLEQIIFRVDALHRLENAGVRIVNSPTTIERTVDKYYTSTLLEDAGLPTPRTVVTERFDEAMAAFHELGGDVVVKPIFGSEGRGIVRVSDPDTAYRVFRALELGRYVYYLQEFVPHGCEDIRVFVIGEEVVAAMVRRGETWKTNVAQGAVGEPLVPDDELREMSLRATRALGADYAGVDILPIGGGGYAVVEINGIPGWRGLQAATGVNIAEHLAGFVLSGPI